MSIFFRKFFLMEQAGGGAGGGGGGAPDWKASLPEDVRAAPSIAKFADPGSLAKSYVELERTLGNSVRPPGPDAGPEAHKAFQERMAQAVQGQADIVYLPKDPKARAEVEPKAFEVLGRPKDAKGYDFNGIDLAGMNAETLAQEAFDAGLTNAQARKIVERAAGAAKTKAEAMARVKAELATTFGAALPQATQEALAAAEQAGAPASVKEAIKNGTADKDTVLMFRNLAKSLGVQPRNLDDQRGGSRSPAMTPHEAEEQIREIMARPEYLNPGKNPDEHARLVKRLGELEAYASPELAAEAARG